MNLDSYISQNRWLASELAKKINVQRELIYQWARNPDRPTPIHQAMKIEVATGGLVRVEEMCPKYADAMAEFRRFVGDCGATEEARPDSRKVS